MLKVGIIGPTDIKKLSKITKKPTKFFLERAKKIGEILAFFDIELWINSDRGMAINIAKFYKKQKGKKVVILYPTKPQPWPKKHARPYLKYADKIEKELNWFWVNYNVVSLPEICICVGLSAGTLSELAYIKWNCQLKRGKLKKLIAIRELLREEQLPPEIEFNVKEILIYLKKVEELKVFLEKIFKKGI